MMDIIIKAGLPAVVIIAATAVAERSPAIASLIIALPLVSVLSLCAIYAETKDTQKIIDMSQSIFWLFIPSLLLFTLLPLLLKQGWSFVAAMMTASVSAVTAYAFCKAIYRWIM
jgi:hypothetical protein